MIPSKSEFYETIVKSYQEDLPNGDLTTDSLGLETSTGDALLVAKQDLVLSGLTLFTDCFKFIDPSFEFHFFYKDSDLVLKGQKVCRIHGNLIQALKAERVALNFLGYFSGIATLANKFQKACSGDVKILDTRKTMPLYRTLSKQAVVDGGAKNHRMNLSDAVMIKENHIRAFGGSANINSFKASVEKLKTLNLEFIEVETTNLEEVKAAVELNVERIMLDNMDDQTLQDALDIIPNHIETEASGNMSIERVKVISKFEGLNYISVGALTHSAPSADLSLLFDWSNQK